MSPRVSALLPLAAALLALGLTAATSFDQRASLPAWAEAYRYGFFLDRYPLFAFAIVYGLAWLVVAATAPGPASLARRGLGGLIGAGLLLALSLYPTFGGLVLRGGFGSGSLVFLAQQPMILAYAIGAAVAALVFGTGLGLGSLLIGRPAGPKRGVPRAFLAGAGGLGVRLLALWFAAAVLGLAREAGFGAWPRRPLTGQDLAVAAALLLVAFLPHTLLTALRKSGGSREAAHPHGLIPQPGYG
ncbi:hypothetical protein [Methylobacterium iners]|uniref:Uncharacterized protein n=1 Tax=Methylobacterium iners TaxID=418707 RepID=A0ABQ4RV39_9HYPH|nr:hypothetical protein [Methylobacterium iners]GJD94240.1 hypothetical protein OCOJLMKI_1442 [Methylobacterium iners]